MEVDDQRIRLVYKGVDVGEEGEILTEVISILEEREQLGVEEIFKELKERGFKFGINKLLALLKKANGKELLELRGAKGKRLYELSQPSFTA